VAAFWSRLQGHWPRLMGGMLALLLIGAHLAARHDPAHGGALNRMEALLYDWRFQALPPQRAPELPIVIVDLDEATQHREGRWPWDRAKVAALVRALQDHGAALIGFDVVFSEAGGNPAETLLQAPDLDPGTRKALTALAPAFDGDQALAAVVGERVVLGYFFHSDGGRAGSLPFPFLELSEQDAARSSLHSLPDYTGNLQILTDSALSGGFVVAIPDADGIVRRMPLAMRHGAAVYPSLALEMARVALGAQWLRLTMTDSGGRPRLAGIRIGNRVEVPVDARAQILVPYRGGAGSYPTISATGALRGDAPPGQLEKLDGALVLVGTSALGLSDLRTIPLQTGFPGVEVHANVLDAILQAALGEQTFYTKPDWEPGATAFLLILSALVLALVLPGRSPAAMLSIAVAWLTLMVGVNLVLWTSVHIALPLAMQLLMVLSLTAFNVAAGYLRTNRQKRAIQNLFGEYVPPAYVERMVAHPELVSLESEQREMTVLFADVRDFTAMSESLSAGELKALLNRYLSAITEVIFEHRGTIDKYVGDLVMAFWNAPLDDEQHAGNAVRAALAMQQRMLGLREEFRQLGWPAFDIGIGVNTGMMSVGDMGSRYRRAYTVMGDAVNLASRLEGATRHYALPVLVGEATRLRADGFLYRPVDRIRVRGRAEPVDIFQPLCPASEAGTAMREQVDRFSLAVAHYRARRWTEARTLLERLLIEDASGAALYSNYLARMTGVDPASLPADWQGVFDHEQK